MRSSVQRTLALLREQRLATAGQPCLERACSSPRSVRRRTRTREGKWPRVILWGALPIVGLLCFLLINGGRKEAPTLSIATPSHNSTVPAGDVPVSVLLAGLRLAPSGAAGGYHLHYYLDANPPTAAGKPATATVGHWASSAIDSYTWRNVAAGTHILSVQLVRGDDTPLAPAVVDSVTVHAVSSISQPSLPASTTPRPPSPGS